MAPLADLAPDWSAAWSSGGQPGPARKPYSKSVGGNVGIGTIDPKSKLHVEGASGWIIADEQDTDPTTTALDSLDAIAIYAKSNKLVIAYNNAGTITYLTIDLDGSDTTWAHSTTAP